MTWTRCPTYPDSDREDWAILWKGRVAGRVAGRTYRKLGGMNRGYVWFWGINTLYQINETHTGEADSYEEAREQFLRAWERVLAKHGLEKVEGVLR